MYYHGKKDRWQMLSGRKDRYHVLVLCFAANQCPNLLIPFFTLINILFINNNAVLITSHKHIFFTLFNRKKPLKIGIQGNNLHFSVTPLRPKFLKKIFLKLSMPKKMTPKSQAKIKPSFPQYPFFNYF